MGIVLLVGVPLLYLLHHQVKRTREDDADARAGPKARETEPGNSSNGSTLLVPKKYDVWRSSDDNSPTGSESSTTSHGMFGPVKHMLVNSLRKFTNKKEEDDFKRIVVGGAN